MTSRNHIVRSMVLFALLGFFVSTAHGQSSYSGALEYSTPQLSSAPPLYSGQPSDIATAYLWLDELMRTSKNFTIEKYIDSLGYGDTLKFLAKMLYRVDDDNPLLYNQWDGIVPWRVVRTLGYKTNPDQERVVLQNHIGATFPDTGRTGFLLACDIISDITITDTMIPVWDMALVRSTINDEIKGKFIPACPDIYKAKKSHIEPLATSIFPAYPDTAAAGTCLNFEYSSKWQKGVFSDDAGPGSFLSDSTGWWVKPGGEYIVFLYLHGVGDDSTKQYFTVDPFWGVFGSQGAMYRVISGHVVDPNDDFGLGGTNLTVADWKSRLRARIYNILNP